MRCEAEAVTTIGRLPRARAERRDVRSIVTAKGMTKRKQKDNWTQWQLRIRMQIAKKRVRTKQAKTMRADRDGDEFVVGGALFLLI